VHAREVDHDPTFTGSVTGTAVAAAPDRQLEAALTSARHDTGNVIRPRDPNHRSRPTVDALKEHLARLVVRGIVWADHLAFELGAEIGDRDLLELLRR
jgi:hypothetical protein